ncbi:hypothetical protein [Streptomyces goshikiensis]
MSASVLREHWVELAYIRGPSGREISTAVDNIEAVRDIYAPASSPSR